jgi:hypothetical protein
MEPHNRIGPGPEYSSFGLLGSTSDRRSDLILMNLCVVQNHPVRGAYVGLYGMFAKYPYISVSLQEISYLTKLSGKPNARIVKSRFGNRG